MVENKGTPPSGDIPPDISSFQSSVKINEVLEGPINNPPQETWRGDFPGGYDEDRALLPSLQKETTKFNLGNGLFICSFIIFFGIFRIYFHEAEVVFCCVYQWFETNKKNRAILGSFYNIYW